jgi:hypothetical protein
MSSIRTPHTTPVISLTFGFSFGASAKNVVKSTLVSTVRWSCLAL